MTEYEHLLNIAIGAAMEAGRATVKYYRGEIGVMFKEDNSPITLADLESNRIIHEYLTGMKIPVLSEESRLVPFSERKNWERLWLIDPLDGTKEFINKSAEYTINIALVEKGIPVLGVVFAPIINSLYYGTFEAGSYRIKTSDNIITKDIRKKAVRLKVKKIPGRVRVVASKSHLTAATEDFIKKLGKQVHLGELKSFGSSLKVCMIAEGSADIYPRLGPTMEWDTAAGHAVALNAGCKLRDIKSGNGIRYNKENLLNPWFVVYNPDLHAAVSAIIG
jgi:3'(2'), 5'-bisphosphate nucleotidase